MVPGPGSPDPGPRTPDPGPRLSLTVQMPQPVRLAFLGCGFITRVHSGHLRALGGMVVPSYASRDRGKADAYCRQYSGVASYGDYLAAIDDPAVDAVAIAVPPRLHL